MYQETDIVQDLYNEIEHLIDIPFESKTNSSPYEPIATAQHHQLDFHYKHHVEEEEEEQQQEITEGYDEEQQQQQHSQEQDHHNNNDYTFERPILIESDSDDIEEEVTTPGHDPQYSVSTCYKCDKPIPFQPNNTLSVGGANQFCADCSNSSSSSTSKEKGRRSRSSSFTFSQLADKLKQSFGHSSSSSSNNHLLAPAGIKRVDRRKSMPSMNSVFQQQNEQQQLQPPLTSSPQPSRPSSRASSFIDDIKQFLAPLSRKSSRSSMYQEYNQQPEMKRKTSHNSLLDAISLCKPSSTKPQRQNPYERRIIQQDDNSWTQEDAEVMGVHHQNSGCFQQQHEEQQQYPRHIPLRRKQIKQIESRQDRMNIYNNAYMEVMSMETELVPWIIKQTQKGPPDAWFGYAPPAREPKKIMGLFKRKAKTTTDLRTQQQQLGDELLHRSTPLLQHRFSNNNLSRSPSNQSFITADHQQQELVASPSAMIQQNYEEQEGYFDEGVDHRFTSPNSYSSFDPRSPSANTKPSNNNYETAAISRAPSASQQQPVSILKKSNSNININAQYNQQQPYNDDYNNEYEVDQYDDQYDEVEGNYDEQYLDHQQQHYAPPARQKQRSSRPSSSSSGMMDDYYSHQQQQLMMPPPQPAKEKRKQQEKSHRRCSSSFSASLGYHQQQQMYVMEPPVMTRRGRSNSGSYRSDYDRDDYYNDDNGYHYHQIPPPQQHHHQQRPSSRHRRQQQHYEEEEEPAPQTAYYNDSIVLNKKKRHNRRYEEEPEQQYDYQEEEEPYYEEEEEYYQQPQLRGGGGRRKSSTSKKDQQQQEDYYGLGVKMTPYMMEEWEMTLDDLCDLYPRLDRHYINDFLRSAQGDFVTAKDMIMDMIMEIR